MRGYKGTMPWWALLGALLGSWLLAWGLLTLMGVIG